MELLIMACQIVMALGIFNVWLVRFNKETPYRGGMARNMVEEFKVYGLPEWFMRTIMVLKLSFALMLLAGLIKPEFTPLGALGLGVLMLGAVTMHIKVRDPFMKALPAAVMLLLCVFVYLATQPALLAN